MTNQPPSQITTPPDGYEWTGDYRSVESGEFGGAPAANPDNWYTVVSGPATATYPILRKIEPPTLIVEMDRELAEYWANHKKVSPWWSLGRLREACTRALEAEAAIASATGDES